MKINKLICIAATICLSLISCGPTPVEQAEQKPILPKEFLIESGPDHVGWVELYTIKHRSSGQRFILLQRSSGGVFLQPITEK